ncbi:MAG: glycosyltransferase family 2 protein [Bacteroidetes bacterium]|nr:glycosyltransferase family 2 protein [Bacteroidota bacterium]
MSQENSNSNPLISVIVPCRNESAYIEKTIQSLFGQKNVPGEIEILVVDGESTDGTRDLLNKISLKDKRLKVISNQKKITPVAMNLGIKEAQGEFIAIMGAHSEYDENYLSECLKLFNIDSSIMCTGGPIFSEGKTSFGKAAAIAMSHPIGVGNAKHRFPNYEGYAEGAGFPVFKKEVLEKIGLYDEDLVRNQDDELNFRLTKSGYKVYISPKAKSKYYVRDNPQKLFNQYFNYGFWRIATLKKHGVAVSFRQLVPALFYLSIILTIGIAPFIPLTPLITILTIPIIYLSIVAIFTSKIMIEKGIKIGLMFPLAIMILHFSYAFGFLKGLGALYKSEMIFQL